MAATVLARKSVLHFANTIVGALLGMVSLKLIAFYMGSTLFGEVAYAMGLVGLLNSVLTLGFFQAHVKRYSEGEDQPDRLATFIGVRMALTVLVLAVMAAFILFRVQVQGKGFQSTTLTTLVLMAVWQVFKNIQEIGFGTFKALRETARSQVSEFGDNLLRTIASILVALSYAAGARGIGPLAQPAASQLSWTAAYGSELLAGAYIAGAALGSAVALWYVLRTNTLGSFRLDIVRSYWDFALPVFLSSLVTQVTNYLDRISLGYFWTAHQAGVYFGVQRITSVVDGLGIAVGGLLFPEISELVEQGREDRVREIIQEAHRYIGMVVIPITAFTVIFSADLITILLSNRFLDGVVTLQLLAVYVLVKVLMRPWASVVQGLNRPGLGARIKFVEGGLNIALNLLLVPKDIASLDLTLAGLKSPGAALATLTASLVAYVLFRRTAARLADVKPPVLHVGRQVAAAGAMGGALVALDAGLLPLTRWYHLLVYPPVGLVVYVAALVAVRGFTREDWEFFVDLLSLEAMADYLREELLGHD